DRPRPVQPSPAESVEPSPPEPPRRRVDADRALLERLGYTSVAHFQRKMMQGEPSGELDAATRRRARQMAALLRRVGYASVKDFQRAHDLTVDGIYGRRTERAVIRALRQARSIVVERGQGADGGG
ncbi:MAG: peptidoglycan-binding domain-containing protein, partial [Planctomycetota bacterium]